MRQIEMTRLRAKISDSGIGHRVPAGGAGFVTVGTEWEQPFLLPRHWETDCAPFKGVSVGCALGHFDHFLTVPSPY